ncbi:MAG: hypothetical protein V1909_00185 [Candidatus Micrarchaeota archaeon]
MQKMELPKASNDKKKRSPFYSKVMSAAKMADFSPLESKKLERIISEAEEREEVITQGIATVLDLAGIPPDDMDEIISILEKAYENVKAGKDPFNEKDLEELESLLRDKISANALARIQANLTKPNEELLGALKDSLEKKTERTQRMKSTPKKK